MFSVDSSKCIRCGYCIEVCPEKAITMHSGSARINEELCVQCGACAGICPAGAIRETALVDKKITEGGEEMPYGYGMGHGGGFGRRGGAGFGFRGSPSPWPYYGRGRGGLPLCWYPGAAVSSSYTPVQPSYSPDMIKEVEVDWLKSQAQVLRDHLEQIETRIKNLIGNKE